MATPTRSAQIVIDSQGEDFVQFVRSSGGIVSWIDNTGAPQGALATSISTNLSLTGNGTSVSPLAVNRGVFFVTDYGAIGDGITDNSAAFAAVAAAANSYTEGTINTQLVGSPTVYLPFGTYVYASGLTFTQPVSLRGELGAILKYTGSANAVTMGPTGLMNSTYHSGLYSVQGLTFTGGASMTNGVVFSNFVVNNQVINCQFRNFGNSSSWSAYFTGNNWDNLVVYNRFWNDDNVVRNGCKINSAGGGNSQLRFIGNDVANLPSAFASTGCNAANAGIGLWSDGTGSNISHNNFNFCSPVVHLGSFSAATRVVNNYGESCADGLGKPIIEFETMNTQSGFIPSTFYVSGFYTNLHNHTYFMGPSSGSQIVSNVYVEHVVATENANGAELINLNNLVGQTGNVYYDLQAANSFIPTTTGGNITAWKTPQLA